MADHMTLPVTEPSLKFPCSSPPPTKRSISSSLNRLLDVLRIGFARVEALVQDWSPFLLVVSYFVFSICMYMICTPGLIACFWFIYLTTNFYIAASTVVEAVMSITPCRDARKAVRKVAENNWVFPTPDDDLLVLDLLIVAYLPNEKGIIMDRINYALEKIVYPKHKIRINVVYNTPVAIEPLETEIAELTSIHSHLRVIKVSGSKSKADNLNYFFTLDTGADIIAVYDCDHYPHPYGPRWAIERFMSNSNIDIVQGRCVVFNTKASFLAAMIAVEFDKIYAVSHPGRAATWGFGLFAGSNGYWRAPLLRELKMDGEMLTEDIDSSLRAVARGAHTVHDLNVVSYELAPTTMPAFWKQRLRWAQGWAQASLKHLILTINKPACGKRSFTERFGLLSLLGIRELSYYFVSQYCCLVASIIILNFPKTAPALVRLLFFQYPVAYWLFIIRYVSHSPLPVPRGEAANPRSIICLIGTLVITDRVKSEFISARIIIVFSVLFPFYLILSAIIGLYGHARQVCKYTSWNPTPRS